MCVQLIKSMCGMSYRPIIIKIRHKRDYPWNVYIPVGFGISVVELMTPICCPVNLFFSLSVRKICWGKKKLDWFHVNLTDGCQI
jgi:hypothetical protein